MILVDGNGMLIQSILAEGIENININFARNIFLSNILKHKKMFASKFLTKDDNLVFCFDDYDYWRKDIFPQYKHKRKEKNSSIDWDKVFDIFHIIKDELKENFPFICLQFSRVEADDIIACLAKYIENINDTCEIYIPIKKILIISEDKDFIQLLKYKNTSFFRPRLKEFYNSYNEEDISKKYYGINEKRVSVIELKYALQEHIIRGDVSDGIPNILSDSDVFVEENKRQKPLKKVNLENWKMQNPDKFLTSNTEANYQRNKQLIDFDEIPSWVYDSIVLEYEKQLTIKRTLNYQYFVKNGLSKILSSVGQF